MKSRKVLKSVSDNLKSKFQRKLSEETMIFIEKEAREALHLLIIDCKNLPFGDSRKLTSLSEMLSEKEKQLQSEFKRLSSDEYRKAVEQGEIDFFLLILSLQSIIINIAETKLNLHGIREWNDNIDNLFFARAKDKQAMMNVFIAASVVNGIASEKEKITRKEQEKKFALQTKEELKLFRRKKLEQDRRKINNILDSMHQRPCV